jgi:hypothetical protein
MKSFILTSIILLFGAYSYAQIGGLTETGDRVILYDDGTWTYVDDSLLINEEIPMNEEEFIKDNKSSFLIKSSKLNIGIWLNPKKWTFTKAKENEDAEYEFYQKGEDLYGMLISEKIEIPVLSLKGIALDNARSVSPDIRIVREEYRMVNGVKVLMMQMSGSIQGMKITYLGYYYSNTNGTIQFLTYTAQNLLDDYRNDMENLLNGLVLLENE